MNKSKIILLSTLAVLSLTACSSKSETSPQSVAETPAPVATSTPIPTSTMSPQVTSIPDNHDFDLYIDQFKDENNIEINPDDNGTDIPDTSILYDWLYNNGVTRESVQNDRDSGCKNPYLEGYLEYLDSLVDKQIAEDNAGQVESSAKGDGLGGTEIIGGDEFILDSDGGGVDQAGVYYTPEEIEYIKEVNSPAELARREKENAEVQQQIKENGEKARAFANDPQAIQDFVNELQGNG